MRNKTYEIVTTALTLLTLTALFTLRFLGLYSHQALAAVLILGVLWAGANRAWLVWKGRLHTGLLRGLRKSENHPVLLHAAGRASFWGMTTAACLWVFPRSAEMAPIIAIVAALGVLRIVVSFFSSKRTNAGPTFVMVFGAAILAFDLGRTMFPGPPAAVQIAPPFKGEWLVGQGGPSPLQNHHIAAYNQQFAIDLLRLKEGYIFDNSGDLKGNAAVHSWEQPLVSPVDGRIVFTRDEMEDAMGADLVGKAEDAAGNVIVIELESGLFAVLAHLRCGTVCVKNGDLVRKGDPLAQVGNSGNTTMPHLHLQVQTHVDLWDPDNRSVPFSFAPDNRIPVRNDRIRGSYRNVSINLRQLSSRN